MRNKAGKPFLDPGHRHAVGGGHADVGEIQRRHAGIGESVVVAEGTGARRLDRGHRKARPHQPMRKARRGRGLACVHRGAEHAQHRGARVHRAVRQGIGRHIRRPARGIHQQRQRAQLGRHVHLGMRSLDPAHDPAARDQIGRIAGDGGRGVELVGGIAVAQHHDHPIAGIQRRGTALRHLNVAVLADAQHLGQDQVARAGQMHPGVKRVDRLTRHAARGKGPFRAVQQQFGLTVGVGHDVLDGKVGLVDGAKLPQAAGLCRLSAMNVPLS